MRNEREQRQINHQQIVTEQQQINKRTTGLNVNGKSTTTVINNGGNG